MVKSEKTKGPTRQRWTMKLKINFIRSMFSARTTSTLLLPPSFGTDEITKGSMIPFSEAKHCNKCCIFVFLKIIISTVICLLFYPLIVLKGEGQTNAMQQNRSKSTVYSNNEGSYFLKSPNLNHQLSHNVSNFIKSTVD